MNNAPELFSSDQEWIVSETRASEYKFHLGQGEGESFEVDGTTVWYKVSAV